MKTEVLHRPPTDISGEATTDQLELAQRQGALFTEAFDLFIKRAGTGEKRRVGDYIVGFTVGKAEGAYHLENTSLKWRDPGDSNAHIEIVVVDGADQRFVPELAVDVTVRERNGNEIATCRHPFVWHPWLYHYGRNWTLPGNGIYTLEVQIAPPLFMRHDKQNGLRYYEPATILFEDVRIDTGHIEE